MDARAAFDHYCPTKVIFGAGSLERLAGEVRPHGTDVLLVTGPWSGGARTRVYETVVASLKRAGMKVKVHRDVRPNPTTEDVARGVSSARQSGCQVVVGLGGGSAMDTAKAIAVAATHEGGIWDYAYFQKTQPTSKTLPIVLVTTTSGTGSHVSKCSVVTNPDNHLKVGVVSPHIFARSAIVDPELMLSVPPALTACTGFDVFSHAFESYVSVNATGMVDAIALEAIRLLARFLPRAHADGGDLEARTMMALADTWAGMSIANVGTTLPHSMGQPISGHFPGVSHGAALAVVYPPIMDFSWESDTSKFATVARIFDPSLAAASELEAARQCPRLLREFLSRIGLRLSFQEIDVDPDAIAAMAADAVSFPDTNVHPRRATEAQIVEMYRAAAGPREVSAGV